MTTTKTKVRPAGRDAGPFERLEALRSEARDAEGRVREAEVRARGAGRRLEAARLALTQYLSGVEAGAKREPERERGLRAELATIQARTVGVQDWTQGVQTTRQADVEAEAALDAARLAAVDAEGKVGAFVAEHRAELAAELQTRALSARDGLLAAIGTFSRAHGEWRTVRATWVDVLGVAPAAIPMSPLPRIAVGDIELTAAQVQGGAKDPRGFIPAPVEAVEGEDEAPTPGELKGWQHVPRVLSSAGGLGA